MSLTSSDVSILLELRVLPIKTLASCVVSYILSSFTCMYVCISIAPTYLPYSGSLRVVGGPFSSVGTLELYLKGKWQNICYNKFTSGAADSACRQLGYTAATTFNKRYSRITFIMFCLKLSY